MSVNVGVSVVIVRKKSSADNGVLHENGPKRYGTSNNRVENEFLLIISMSRSLKTAL